MISPEKNTALFFQTISREEKKKFYQKKFLYWKFEIFVRIENSPPCPLSNNNNILDTMFLEGGGGGGEGLVGT